MLKAPCIGGSTEDEFQFQGSPVAGKIIMLPSRERCVYVYVCNKIYLCLSETALLMAVKIRSSQYCKEEENLSRAPIAPSFLLVIFPISPRRIPSFLSSLSSPARSFSNSHLVCLILFKLNNWPMNKLKIGSGARRRTWRGNRASDRGRKKRRRAGEEKRRDWGERAHSATKRRAAQCRADGNRLRRGRKEGAVREE